MARIFLSHSSQDNPSAIALRDWLVGEGWDDLFLDLDPERGIAAGERWERKLNEAALRCEAVLFLVSRAWLASGWCRKELQLACKLNKRIFCLLIGGLAIKDLPPEITRDWQVVDLAGGRDHQVFRTETPNRDREEHVTFSRNGLAQLKAGLNLAGLEAKYFAWPPESEPFRAPYRGLKALDAEDAGIFFGREASIIEGLDRLRGLRVPAAPSFFVVLGASGAGKSSFLRAGLLPRLARDDRHFLPLPVLRPGRAAISGETGLLQVLVTAFENAALRVSRSQIQSAIAGGAASLALLLARLSDRKSSVSPGEPAIVPPSLVLAIDQGEELFLAEGTGEAQSLLALVRDLIALGEPSTLALIGIRSEAYDKLQSASALEGVRLETMSLPPMPRGAYETIIEGPARRLEGTERALKIDPAMTQALLEDLENGGAKDALPLLAFTLERLYLDHGGDGDLTLAEYRATGGIKGSIEAAVERALADSDADARVPKDRTAKLVLLRRALIPWLAGIDPDSALPRRRIARLLEIPAEARPLVDCFIHARLLSTDMTASHAVTIEPAHEALLRQWGMLEGWLKEDFAALSVLDGVKRATLEWEANARNTAWLAHAAARLKDAERFGAADGLRDYLDAHDRDYIAACGSRETRMRRQAQWGNALVLGLVLLLTAGAAAWWNGARLVEAAYWWREVRSHVLSATQEKALAPRSNFQECSDCPPMVVVPRGQYQRGADLPDKALAKRQLPVTQVMIASEFAVSETEITFAQWDVCARYGGCTSQISEGEWGRGDQPLINITWHDAQQYAAWLSHITGKHYRLLSEAEWEYAARAGTTSYYSFANNQNIDDFAWYAKNADGQSPHPHPVRMLRPNPFGLYDMHGNVGEWVEDCVRDSYDGAPVDGSALTASANCNARRTRGGDYLSTSGSVSSASRDWRKINEADARTGMRVARLLVRE